MLVPVLHRDDEVRGDMESRLLPRFLYGVLLHGKSRVHPAAGERPQSVVLPDKKDTVVFEYSRAGIKLRGLIPGLAAEKLLHRIKRQAGGAAEHFCRDLPHTLKPLNIIHIPAVVQSRLTDGLKLYRPLKPLFFSVHSAPPKKC